MKISTILDHIDSGHMALPEFQRGYVWNRGQVRGLFDSLYRRHPVGGLLVWATESSSADHRGEGSLAPGIVKLLLDGQQRMTSLYGVARGQAPKFFDGDRSAFTGLRFHLEQESFEFHQQIKMKDDPLWIDVTTLIRDGQEGVGRAIQQFGQLPEFATQFGVFAQRLNQLLGILDIDLHVEEVTGRDKTLDVVVDIFNRVNSGGTKLSKGDLALAKICADWPEGRATMRSKLAEWESSGFDFNLDWLLRSVNTVLTGEAKFLHLHDKPAVEIQEALHRAGRHIDTCLNLVASRLGLDHDQVFFGRFAIPVMARYLEQRAVKGLGPMNEVERDKLLFWFVQAAMWGRFSGSTESFIDKDLEAIEGGAGDLDRLVEQLRLWHGGLRAEAGHFTGWSLGSRFYPVLYMLTRMGEAKDWGTGLALRASLLGRMSRLEVHHIFPKARLYGAKALGFRKSEVNALANFCFLTKDTNLRISDRLPEDYFPEVEAAHPGALASQWIPMDPSLWRLENFRDFLEARKVLLADALNTQMEALLHGDLRWLASDGARHASTVVVGAIDSAEEEAALRQLNEWVVEQGLPRGVLSFEQADPATGAQVAVLDLAWPSGLQEGLSEPVAVLLNEEAATIALASQGGYRCFTDASLFQRYVTQEVLGSSLEARSEVTP